MKIGVISPLHNRPDFARFLALQLENQSMRPDLVAFHQNGTPDSYEWAISDIDRHYESVWLHTPNQIAQDEWYAIPLEHLINAGRSPLNCSMICGQTLASLVTQTRSLNGPPCRSSTASQIPAVRRQPMSAIRKP